MIHITALARGGYSAYGAARYDARADMILIHAFDTDETRTLTVQWPEDIDSVTESEEGLTGTTPTISGDSFTATLSGLNNGARIKYLVTSDSGVRALEIIVNGIDGCESDYGY